MHPGWFRAVSPKCIKHLPLTTTDISSFKQMCLLLLLWSLSPVCLAVSQHGVEIPLVKIARDAREQQ